MNIIAVTRKMGHTKLLGSGADDVCCLQIVDGTRCGADVTCHLPACYTQCAAQAPLPILHLLLQGRFTSSAHTVSWMHGILLQRRDSFPKPLVSR